MFVILSAAKNLAFRLFLLLLQISLRHSPGVALTNEALPIGINLPTCAS